VLTLEQAEEFARSLDGRVLVEGDHIRPELLRREDAIVVLWRELRKLRAEPSSQPPTDRVK
jgi:hypothetical protein